MKQGNIAELKYNEDGLIPAIAQDINTNEVVMMAWMNAESLEMSMASGKATYFSRSRQKLWIKGETSGNTQEICGIYYDCDADTILLKIRQKGNACHTGEYSCFHNTLIDNAVEGETILRELFAVIQDRKINPKEGSYTNYLFDKGVDKICKKVGEEAAESIIAAKNNDKNELTYEISDLFYHLMVLMAQIGIDPDDVFKELKSRR